MSALDMKMSSPHSTIIGLNIYSKTLISGGYNPLPTVPKSTADFIFYKNQLFQNILSGIPTECQTVWIQIRPDLTSG